MEVLAMVNNSLAAKNQQPKFSVAIRSDMYKNLINNTLGDAKRATRFIASISSAIATSPNLQDCDAGTILSSALLGESLNLSPSPQLGQYYLVPFNDNNNDRKVAQFQLGYKGYIQLAIRSGQYKKLNVIAIKEGELIRYDAMNEDIECALVEDEEERENTPTVGYYAMFELQNGFRKTMYWSKAKMEGHALKYSKGYKAKKGYTFWEKDFDGMAFKTMLRQLISKWGIMSIELLNAFEKDMAVIDEKGNAQYVDSDNEPIVPIQAATIEPTTVPQEEQPQEVDPLA